MSCFLQQVSPKHIFLGDRDPKEKHSFVSSRKPSTGEGRQMH